MMEFINPAGMTPSRYPPPYSARLFRASVACHQKTQAHVAHPERLAGRNPAAHQQQGQEGGGPEAARYLEGDHRWLALDALF